MTSINEIQKVAYKTGDFIFLEGDQETHFYIVESGRVQIFTKKAGGERINICEITEGESFGEFALLDKAPRSASAKALTDVVLVQVSAEGYEKLLSEIPVWSSTMLRSFMVRLKNMNSLLKTQDQFIKK
jgi:CRP/FNR family transcriptional regulator, cyclic AMP receptor protein